MVTLSKLLRTLAQIPNFRASLGQVAVPEGVEGVPGLGVEGVPGLGVEGVPGLGVGLGLGLGFGFGRGHVLQALATMVKKRRLTTRKRASEAVLLEAISSETLEAKRTPLTF